MSLSDSPKVAPTLKAKYVSPSASQTISHSLPPTSPTDPTSKKTAYLSMLRVRIVEMQREVNGLLTAKMEKDKAIAATNGAKVDEKKEEENYGEEVVEDED
ncbi:MAG: hypothetical protein FRX48_01244 [Lasallia pustulata]|uniref:EKC/KEOPS complex subunit GON7 n=1 Tax=Lasallia pustulata TaxID=136370 RepID=A0A1W5CUW7_9LECA|nr:MAG: hypothetical protein FRX48_01244 [Lasallia pustulata]SLM34647.1 EKC/KEOPS complex, subunit Gon7 [Lasallia pustulata]